MQTPRNYRVPVDELSKHVNPLGGRSWQCAPIQDQEIRQAVKLGIFPAETWDEIGYRSDLNRQSTAIRDWHIGRVAKFVAQGLPKDELIDIICLRVDSCDEEQITIDNGNHRIAAAIFRGDANVLVRITSMSEEDIRIVLPGAIPA